MGSTDRTRRLGNRTACTPGQANVRTDPISVLGTHLSETIRRYAHELFSRQDAKRLLDRVASQLPPQDADILRQVFRRRALEVRTARAELDKAIAEALEQLGQPELDVAKLRAAVENAREKRNRQGDILLEGFFEALERISPEGRKALVTRFSRR